MSGRDPPSYGAIDKAAEKAEAEKQGRVNFPLSPEGGVVTEGNSSFLP